MIDESDDDLERILAEATPRPAPAELRSLILAAVAAELDERSAHPKPGWQSWMGRAVAAGLLFSVVTYAGVAWRETRRMAAWDGRPVVRSDVAEVTAAIASVTDEPSAQAVQRVLLSQLHAGVRPSADAIRQEVREVQNWAEGGPLADGSHAHETNQDRI